MELQQLLAETAQRKASDLHIKAGSKPILRIHGHLEVQDDLPLNSVFTIACANEAEVTLAGLAAIECKAVGAPRIHLDPALTQVSQNAYDYVIGLQPGKGGAFEQRQVEGLFPRATVVLV